MKQRRPPPSHKAANADLCQAVVRVWRGCSRDAREAARKLGMSEGGVRHYLDRAREGSGRCRPVPAIGAVQQFSGRLRPPHAHRAIKQWAPSVAVN
jgi:hypothetical protein